MCIRDSYQTKYKWKPIPSQSASCRDFSQNSNWGAEKISFGYCQGILSPRRQDSRHQSWKPSTNKRRWWITPTCADDLRWRERYRSDYNTELLALSCIGQPARLLSPWSSVTKRFDLSRESDWNTMLFIRKNLYSRQSTCAYWCFVTCLFHRFFSGEI